MSNTGIFLDLSGLTTSKTSRKNRNWGPESGESTQIKKKIHKKLTTLRRVSHIVSARLQSPYFSRSIFFFNIYLFDCAGS